MPLPRKKLCIFGDSHLASVKRALDGGLIDMSAFDVEFWGAKGAYFRQLHMQDGAIVAEGEAADMVAAVNGRGRTHLRAQDFDCVLFYGARLRISEFFAPFLERMHGDGVVDSEAVIQAAAETWLTCTRAFRFARVFAEQRDTQVFFAPGPLPTVGAKDFTIKNRVLQQYPNASKATAADRDLLWRALMQQAGSTGVQLLRQPEETVVGGVFTDARYGVENAQDSEDAGHKSPAFAALMLEQFSRSAQLEAA